MVHIFGHTAVHTTVEGPSGHLPTLSRRVLQLTETTGQPGIALIGPASCAQRLAARGASKGILTAFATIRDESADHSPRAASRCARLAGPITANPGCPDVSVS